MGYSFSLPCHTAKHAEELAAFLRANLRPFGLVCDEHRIKVLDDIEWLEKNVARLWPLPTARSKRYAWQNIGAGRVCLGDELAYGAAKSKVGFNTPIGDDSRYFMWALLAWASTKVGRRRHIAGMARLGRRQPVRYMTYDSDPHIVLSVAEMEGWDEEAVRLAHLWGWVRDDMGLLPRPKTTLEAASEWITARYREGSRKDDQSFLRFTHEKLHRESVLWAISQAEMQRLDALWESRP